MDEAMAMTEELMGGLVRELAGGQRTKFTHEDGKVDDVDFESAFRQYPFMVVLEAQLADLFGESSVVFPQSFFGEDQNTGTLLQVCYKESCRARGVGTNPTWVKEFPPVMCRITRLGCKERADLLVLGVPVMEVTRLEMEGRDDSTTVIKLDELSRILVDLGDASFLTQVMPAWWKNLHDIPIQDMPVKMEEVLHRLDVMWRNFPSRNQKRVVYLFNTISSSLSAYIQDKLREPDVFKGPFIEVRNNLQLGMVVCEKWMMVTRDLTTLYWREEWQGDEYEDLVMDNLSNRLGQVLKMRSEHFEVLQLLEKREADELQLFGVWKVFNNVDPLYYSEYLQAGWENAMQAFETKIAGADTRVAAKLRNAVLEATGRPNVLTETFRRFRFLVKRPKVLGDLKEQRELLLSNLSKQMESLKKVFETNPEVAKAINDANQYGNAQAAMVPWARRLSLQARDIMLTCDCLMRDLPNAEAVRKEAEDFRSKIQAYEKKCRDDWVADLLDLLKDMPTPLTIYFRGSILNPRTSGTLAVVLHPTLPSILQEARQLNSCGFGFPHDLQDSLLKVRKFVMGGTLLHQVSTLYNQLRDQVIKPHRLAVFELVHACESMLGSSKGKDDGKPVTKAIPWKNDQEPATMVVKLLTAIRDFCQKNRSLRKMHMDLCQKVLVLMEVSLLKQQEKWKSILVEMMDTLNGPIGGNRYEDKVIEPWKMHWDYQLYKAMEHQYQSGLNSLTDNIPEISCELVFKQQQVHFKPSHEVLRERYYMKMKDFINIPYNFQGVAKSSFFSKMGLLNGKAISKVYLNAELLFFKLNRLKKRFKEFSVLGTVDIDNLIRDRLKTTEEFERHFSMCRDKLEECAAVEDLIKVEVISISTEPLKAAVADQIARLREGLFSRLEVHLKGHLAEIDEFLKWAITSLEKKPSNIDEIGHSYADHKKMTEEKPKIEDLLFRVVDSKNQLLRLEGASTVDSSSSKTKWDRFCDLYTSFESQITTQKEKMKNSIGTSIKQLAKDVIKFASQWNKGKPKDITHYKTRDEIKKRAVEFVEGKREEFNELRGKSNDIIKQWNYFYEGEAEPDFCDMDDVEEDLVGYEEVWGVYSTFEAELDEMAKEEWLVFRMHQYRFEDFCKEWEEKLHDDAYEETTVISYIKRRLAAWREHIVPLMKFLRGDGFSKEHWAAMFKLCGVDKNITADQLRFYHFLDQWETLIANADEIRKLEMRAMGEIKIRDALQEVKTWAMDTYFQISMRTERGRTIALIKEWKEVIAAVGDMQSLLLSLKDSPYYKNFEDEGNIWATRFVLLDSYLNQLMVIQRKWVYLEPIFMRGSLPSEAARFKQVDKQFVTIMKDVEADSRVVSLSKNPGLKDILHNILDQLERCQKALSEFMEQKRDKFPRFYFIGDDDLLEILGQSQNPTVIQAHLKKLFAGIATVKFDSDEKQIVGMFSAAKEYVPLSQNVIIKPEVEAWLDDLDREMKRTLVKMTWDCFQEQENPNFKFYPSQILCLNEGLHFTQEAEEAIEKKAVPQLKQKYQGKLKTYTELPTVGDKVLGLKMKSLIMDIIHYIDVCDQLIRVKTEDLADWQWVKQLRFYFDEEHKVILRIVDARFLYTYEYQGNAPKLVHTPLTDKCYLTLTQGQHLGYGGQPFGPAGTGKTESVKALGNAFGRQVLVFNCDEGIDFKSMGRIFTGLCKCGAWGCFDEFNRLKEDQLSAVSDMIQVIQAALKAREPVLMLLKKRINLDFSAGIFVTMNPAGKRYGGRSKLPDNLKQLFRAVAMTVPDSGLIVETELFSEGFLMAKEVGKKVTQIFDLSSQLLSSQLHYDWGLRALKSILRVGGALLYKEKMRLGKEQAEAAGKELTDGAMDFTPPEDIFTWESEIVIKSLRVNTLSKLTWDDSQRFIALVSDVFKGVKMEDVHYADLEAAIAQAYKDLRLQAMDAQIAKILQFYEALNQRMGVVIVGPSGAGKSTLHKVLRCALQQLLKHGGPHNVKVPLYSMNPKAIPRHQLLGFMDNDTREWNDGVLTAASRKVVLEPMDGTVRSWILCDGDVDPKWIESLNSVLDDNRLLTMPNGERIQFGENVNFVFETHSLFFASPATVSRMGVIYLSEADVDPSSAIRSWLDTIDDKAFFPLSLDTLLSNFQVRGEMEKWMEQYFQKSLDILILQFESVVETTQMGFIQSALAQLHSAECKGEFALGLIRGLGSYLIYKDREEFAKKIFQLVGENPCDSKKPLECFYSRVTNSFQPYQYQLGLEMTIKDLRANTMVKTNDVLRNVDVFHALIECQKPFILVGDEGTGKTMVLTNYFNSLPNIAMATIFCSAQTDSKDVIAKLFQCCNKASTSEGVVLKPKEKEYLVLFLRDINLPRPDMYDTTELHSFLTQLILYRGFYDTSLEWMGVQNVLVVGSMNQSGAIGRYPLAPRFTAISAFLHISYPDREQLQSVYTEYIQALVSEPPLSTHEKWGSGRTVKELAALMVGVYDQVKKKYSVDEHSHYQFTPRDLTNWVTNLLSYDLNACEFVDVLAYEGQRLFSDRLVSASHRTKFDKILFDSMASAFGFRREKFEQTDHRFVSWAHELSGKQQKKPDKNPKKKVETRRKLAPVDKDAFRRYVEKAIIAYGRDHKPIRLQQVPEVIRWIPRTDRVLAMPGGSLLFTGKCGVGRRDVVLVAASMMRVPSPSQHHPHTLWQMSVKVCNMVKNYNMKLFKADLKAAIIEAGTEKKDVCFILEDHNCTDPVFVEMVNSLLASGEVPGLFGNEEMNQILGPLQEEAMAEQFYGGAYNFFVDRIQRYLHVVILFDPANKEYELRCQSNPALYTKCSIQWMDTWSQESLQEIPSLELESLFATWRNDEKGNEKGLQEVETKVKNVCEDLVWVHTVLSAQQGATPRQFVQFLRGYQKVYEYKHGYVFQQTARLRGGLDKIKEAEVEVARLKEQAAKQKKSLAKAQEQADAALEKIQESMEVTAKAKDDAKQSEKLIAGEKSKVQRQQQLVYGELSEVQPLLDGAKEAVRGIKQEHLTELISMPRPPEPVRDVLMGVLGILGLRDTSWTGMKKFLQQRGVKDSIIEFDARKINASIRSQVGAILEQKASSYEQANIQRASRAAAPLAGWVYASIRYSEVLEKVDPLEKELETLTDSLSKTQEQLDTCIEKVKTLDAKVTEMKKKFREQTSNAERLRVELEKAEETIRAAEDLLSKLRGEKDRWDITANKLIADLTQLPRQAVVASAFMTYLAVASEDKRAQMMTEWRTRFKIDKDFDFRKFMRSESDLLTYKGEGLPSDDLSMENSICILEATQTPLMIDPAESATAWLKNHIKGMGRTLEVTAVADDKFSNTLELAVRFGKTLLIVECDKVEPVLYPILRGDLVDYGTKKVVMLGEKHVEYDENFQLFLVTRNPELELTPDSKTLITPVNFAITKAGLEGQLLGYAIHYEKPELEEKKQEMLKQEEEFKVQLVQLEEMLLHELCATEGSLLENVSLINALNEIKTKSTGIEEALRESRVLNEDLDRQRNEYRPYAQRGALTFFVMSDLSVVNNMYRFALSIFVRLFHVALEQNKGYTGSVASKINPLNQTLMKVSYQYVARSLFKEDRLMYALHLAHGLFPDQFPRKEYDCFLGITHPASDQKLPAWVDHDARTPYLGLKGTCPALFDKLQLNKESEWSKWVSSATPEQQFPMGLDAELSPFQRMLVIQAFRADRLALALDTILMKVLGLESLNPPPTNMQTMAEESNEKEPILLIVTPGADATLELAEMAERVVGKTHFRQLAMGGGMTEEAIKAVRECATTGDWLCLKNLHLVITWVPSLEKEITLLRPNEKFRLWLSSEAHDQFPILLCQMSQKATFEAPPGVKKSLMRTYDLWTPEYIKSATPLQAQILFVLAWFHAIALERRNYSPQGWSKVYEFSLADMRCAADIIGAQCRERDIPDWNSIYGLLENAIYGGRFDNDPDIRLLFTFLQLYFNDDILGYEGPGKQIAPPNRKSFLTRGMTIPLTNDHKDYISVIQKVPDVDEPYVFNLSANADRLVAKMRIFSAVDKLCRLSAGAVESGKMTHEQWVEKLQPVVDYWQGITKQHQSVLFVKLEKEVRGRKTDLRPIASFVNMEVETGRKLVNMIQETFEYVSKVIQGSALLTTQINLICDKVLEGGVPRDWDKLWEGPEQINKYLLALVSRVMALLDWKKKLEADKLLDSPLNLGNLFRPGTFLNALRQETARRGSIPLDDLQLDCEWGDHSKLAHSCLAVTIEGLLIQGCKFDKGRLSDLSSDAPGLNPTPVCKLGWVAQVASTEKRVSCPVYLTSEREKQLTDLYFPVEKPEEKKKWIMMGFAILLEA